MQSALACAVLLASGASAEWVDVYKRLPPGALAREMAAQSAPAYPFKNFSAAYVKKALSQPINWTALGAVTPVKDQGEHGYCGTFGRVGACEGQLAIKKGLLVSLAEEELIDCIGWDQDQFSYFSPNGFMPTSIYPYNKTGPDMDPPIPWNPCRYNRSLIVQGTDNAFFNGTTGAAPDEDQMAAFLTHNGPTQVGINAKVFSYLPAGCSARGDCFVTRAMCELVKGQQIDHSVLLVGHSSDPALGDYWTIKNSWGTAWGNAGYIKVARGVDCASLCCGNMFTVGDPAAYYE